MAVAGETKDDRQASGLKLVDGRDALAYVIIRPGEDDHIVVEAEATRISKVQAAYVMRQLADRWDPPAPSV